MFCRSLLRMPGSFLVLEPQPCAAHRIREFRACARGAEQFIDTGTARWGFCLALRVTHCGPISMEGSLTWAHPSSFQIEIQAETKASPTCPAPAGQSRTPGTSCQRGSSTRVLDAAIGLAGQGSLVILDVRAGRTPLGSVQIMLGSGQDSSTWCIYWGFA